MPSFKQVMAAVVDTYRHKRRQVETTAHALADDLSRTMLEAVSGEPGMFSTDLLDTAAAGLTQRADPVHGGLTRGKPKFPNPISLDNTSALPRRDGQRSGTAAVSFTLAQDGAGRVCTTSWAAAFTGIQRGRATGWFHIFEKMLL